MNMIFKKHKQENKVKNTNGGCRGFTQTLSLALLPSFLIGFLQAFSHIIKAFFMSSTKQSNKKTMPNLVSGFTLVEAMTAIFILTFAIVGLMTMVSSSLFAAKYARDDITVNYLLQESIDYIRNDRDTMVFLASGAGSTDPLWTNFSDKYNACSVARGCWIDVLADVPADVFGQCPVGGCPYLYYDEDATNTAFYVTDNGLVDTTGMKKTVYQRKISVVRNLDQIDVTATITWKNGNLNKSRVLTTSLTRWQK